MSKNIVICCDGTGNEFGNQNSNVVKLYKMLVYDATQIAYYHPGVGTMGARNAPRRIGKWLPISQMNSAKNCSKLKSDIDTGTTVARHTNPNLLRNRHSLRS